ncbi:class I SAM-dependent methyltransferase [Marichromatium sp. AB31]|uniref:class I SAM-dependent methyltransferase n=1 Tax=Marichromatium sp. AB31 TaxID=2483362 RepID=UPI000F3CA196|nr:class I SAM-dependent methyltransferase [Marichromatium sp. AB31]RNE91186.1 class I SAM-dependent methyltransferase [Marichromatium sp. AB31]
MIGSDARILLHLLRGQRRQGSHAERLQHFYAPQAAHYDRFRERLLHGRAQLIAALDPTPGAYLVELGAGTGRNLLYLGERLDSLGRIDLVDLCPALLDEARRRTAGLARVRVIEADAADYRPEGPVDCVYCAYSLTMTPNWRAVLANALAMLRPGGTLGVVDFYVSDAQGGPGNARHGTLARAFWPRWFAHDGVHPSPEPLRWLRDHLPDHQLDEHLAPVPYLPGLRVPYYRFVGRKSLADSRQD